MSRVMEGEYFASYYCARRVSYALKHSQRTKSIWHSHWIEERESKQGT